MCEECIPQQTCGGRPVASAVHEFSRDVRKLFQKSMQCDGGVVGYYVRNRQIRISHCAVRSIHLKKLPRRRRGSQRLVQIGKLCELTARKCYFIRTEWSCFLAARGIGYGRSEEHTSELQSQSNLVF